MIWRLLKIKGRGNTDAATSKGTTHHVHHVDERHDSNAIVGEATVSFKAGSSGPERAAAK